MNKFIDTDTSAFPGFSEYLSQQPNTLIAKASWENFPSDKLTFAWSEKDHPRGNPDNPGQFTSGGGGGKKTEDKKKEPTKKNVKKTVKKSKDGGPQQTTTTETLTETEELPVGHVPVPKTKRESEKFVEDKIQEWERNLKDNRDYKTAIARNVVAPSLSELESGYGHSVAFKILSAGLAGAALGLGLTGIAGLPAIAVLGGLSAVVGGEAIRCSWKVAEIRRKWEKDRPYRERAEELRVKAEHLAKKLVQHRRETEEATIVSSLAKELITRVGEERISRGPTKPVEGDIAHSVRGDIQSRVADYLRNKERNLPLGERHAQAPWWIPHEQQRVASTDQRLAQIQEQRRHREDAIKHDIAIRRTEGLPGYAPPPPPPPPLVAPTKYPELPHSLFAPPATVPPSPVAPPRTRPKVSQLFPLSIPTSGKTLRELQRDGDEVPTSFPLPISGGPPPGYGPDEEPGTGPVVPSTRPPRPPRPTVHPLFHPQLPPAKSSDEPLPLSGSLPPPPPPAPIGTSEHTPLPSRAEDLDEPPPPEHTELPHELFRPRPTTRAEDLDDEPLVSEPVLDEPPTPLLPPESNRPPSPWTSSVPTPPPPAEPPAEPHPLFHPQIPPAIEEPLPTTKKRPKPHPSWPGSSSSTPGPEAPVPTTEEPTPAPAPKKRQPDSPETREKKRQAARRRASQKKSESLRDLWGAFEHHVPTTEPKDQTPPPFTFPP